MSYPTRCTDYLLNVHYAAIIKKHRIKQELEKAPS